MSSRSWQDSITTKPAITRFKHRPLIQHPPETGPAIEAVCLRYEVYIPVRNEMTSVRPHKVCAQTRCQFPPSHNFHMENPNVAPGITNLLGPAAPSDSLAAIQISQRCGTSPCERLTFFIDTPQSDFPTKSACNPRPATTPLAKELPVYLFRGSSERTAPFLRERPRCRAEGAVLRTASSAILYCAAS